MTTLTQSELDDMRRRVQGPSDAPDTMTSPGCVHALLDHIAQLTAERDEAIADNDDCHFEIAGKDTRIAALEAQPSAQFVAGKLEGLRRAALDANEIIEWCAKAVEEFALRSDISFIPVFVAFAIRALKTPQMTQTELAVQDAVLHGTGYMQAGKRIDPSEIYLYEAVTAEMIDGFRVGYNGYTGSYDIGRSKLETDAIRAGLEYAMFGQPYAQFVAGKLEGLRRAAEIVRDNCETYSTTGGDERKELSPRRSGDLAGLSYAAAILAEGALKQ